MSDTIDQGDGADTKPLALLIKRKTLMSSVAAQARTPSLSGLASLSLALEVLPTGGFFDYEGLTFNGAGLRGLCRNPVWIRPHLELASPHWRERNRFNK